MKQLSLRRWLAAGALSLGLLGPAAAQDFVLPYNRTPETAPEFWAATKYDLGLGNQERAAQMLGHFYDKVMALGEDEQRKFFLNMYDREGISPLLRLTTIPAVQKVERQDPATGKNAPAANLLVARMTKFIDARLSDPDRIRFFVTQLGGRPEQRAYAIAQLRASGARSIPAMLDVLRDPGQQQLHGAIYSALLKMDRDIGPPLLAALDSKSDFIKSLIVDVFANRADSRIVPDLYHLSAAKSSTPALQEKAKTWLTKFLSKPEKALGDPRAALVAQAEKYHQHQVDLGTQQAIWTWNDQSGLSSKPASPSQIEEALAIGFARKALDLDPGYRPAQIALLSVALDKQYERSGPGANLGQAAPELQALLAASPVELLLQVLHKALADGRTTTALGAAKALAAHGDPQVLKMSENGPSPLLQALRYPDRRVQFAAAEAALAVANNTENYPGNSRVIEVLSRAIAGTGATRALVGLGNPEESNRLVGLLKPLGFEAQVVRSGKQLIHEAASESNVGLVVVDTALPAPGFDHFLAEYRNNPATAGTPLLVVAEGNQGRYAADEVAKLPGAKVIARAPLTGDLLKADLQSLLGDPAKKAPSAEERSSQANKAVEYLARIARGEIKGYDLRAADAALLKALTDDALAAHAAQALAYRPSKEAQTALAGATLNESRPAPIRAAAASALRAHVQRFGNRLSAEQVNGITQLSQAAADATLREQADLTAATLRADAANFGNRLKGFTPGAGATPVKVEPGKDGN